MGSKLDVEFLYYEASDNFNDDSKTEASYNAMQNEVSKFAGKGYSKLDDLIGNYAVDMERQGFIAGFQYAVRMFGIDVGGVNESRKHCRKTAKTV